MISVIGGGPAGCFYASKVKDKEVHIFEKKKEVGLPVSCTGILTDSINRVTKIPKELIFNKVNKFKIVAPNGKSIYVDMNKPNLIIDRAGFDRHILQKAIDNGAKIHYGEEFKGFKKLSNKKNKQFTDTGFKIKTSKGTHVTDMIVGADGPFSEVAKTSGMYRDRKFLMGWQSRCKFKGLEEGVTEIRMGYGEFSWIVPEDDKIARVGVIGKPHAKLKQDYNKLIGNNKIIENQSGVVPLYNVKQKLRMKKDDVFLIGDAATQVKATTYGGIIYGLLAGKYLAEDKESYSRKFKMKLGKELWLSLKMRETFNHMTEKQSNDLVKIFEKESNQKILGTHDRDFPSKFILKLLLKEPNLWKLGLGVFKNKVNIR